MSACVLVQRDLVPQEGRQARDEAPVYVPSGAHGVIAMRVDVHGSEQAAPAEIELQPLQQEPRALGGLLQNERHHCACANAALCLIQQCFLLPWRRAASAGAVAVAWAWTRACTVSGGDRGEGLREGKQRLQPNTSH